MLERGVYLSMFYSFLNVKYISMYMLEEQVLEERYPELNEEEDIRTEDIM